MRDAVANSDMDDAPYKVLPGSLCDIRFNDQLDNVQSWYAHADYMRSLTLDEWRPHEILTMHFAPPPSSVRQRFVFENDDHSRLSRQDMMAFFKTQLMEYHAIDEKDKTKKGRIYVGQCANPACSKYDLVIVCPACKNYFYCSVYCMNAHRDTHNQQDQCQRINRDVYRSDMAHLYAQRINRVRRFY